tara:strand:+ start:223 stop:735 length:513 start_codon:yes stop_codon:yes gene_type:complete
VIKQDTLENRVNYIYLAIGSNLGNRKDYIEKAKFKLSQNKVFILKSSNFYESLSWPNPKDPKFLNIVIKVSTNYTPLNLINKCHEIERSLGRNKNKRNAPRTCDIDIIDFKRKIVSKNITLPHPRMHKRSFVLFPLFEIDKDWKHPKNKNHIKNLIMSLPNRDIRSIKQY